jgi:hypothetical protein
MFRSLAPTKSLSSKLILFSLVSLCLPMLILTWTTTSMASSSLLDITRERIEK